MKFEKMNSYQQDAYKSLLIEGIKYKFSEEASFTQQFYKMLLIANGSGIAIMASFINSIAKQQININNLSSPLVYFFIGVVSSSTIYFIFMSIASQAVGKFADQYIKVISNELDIESIQSWGLSKRGVKIVLALLVVSLGSFFVGVYKSINIINSIFNN